MNKEIDIISSKEQLVDFKASFIWRDIYEELESWKHAFEMELKGIVEESANTNPSTASVLMHIGDINGRIKAVEYMQSLPDVFINILEDKQNDSKHS